jgi:hypothetical protein
MESSFVKGKYPKFINFNKDTSTDSDINLIVHGQGVFVFENTDNSKLCSFNLYNKDKSDGFTVDFTLESVLVNRIAILEPLVNSKTSGSTNGLTDANGAYYWFSIDSQNQKFYAGIGEPRLETITYEYAFSFNDNNLRETNKLFLESITHIKINIQSRAIGLLKLLRDPITLSIAQLVKNSDELSMDIIASGKYLPKSNLSPTAQILYDCISGKNFVLNSPDFPDFSKAIEYSIATEGLWCNKRLKEKSTEFSKTKPNIDETYLRITLGQNNGESPGIPYVMEIWPVGHYSPIHNHSAANAIIRVLNGTINVNLYPFLSTTGVKPYANVNFVQDDITWISPNLNQTHKLENLPSSKETCITIQCYMYENDDIAHYDYFDYIDADGQRKQYEPDSDMDFVQFKMLMKKEWASRPKQTLCDKLRKLFKHNSK